MLILLLYHCNRGRFFCLFHDRGEEEKKSPATIFHSLFSESADSSNWARKKKREGNEFQMFQREKENKERTRGRERESPKLKITFEFVITACFLFLSFSLGEKKGKKEKEEKPFLKR